MVFTWGIESLYLASKCKGQLNSSNAGRKCSFSLFGELELVGRSDLISGGSEHVSPEGGQATGRSARDNTGHGGSSLNLAPYLEWWFMQWCSRKVMRVGGLAKSVTRRFKLQNDILYMRAPFRAVVLRNSHSWWFSPKFVQLVQYCCNKWHHER